MALVWWGEMYGVRGSAAGLLGVPGCGPAVAQAVAADRLGRDGPAGAAVAVVPPDLGGAGGVRAAVCAVPDAAGSAGARAPHGAVLTTLEGWDAWQAAGASWSLG